MRPEVVSQVSDRLLRMAGPQELVRRCQNLGMDATILEDANDNQAGNRDQGHDPQDEDAPAAPIAPGSESLQHPGVLPGGGNPV